MSKHKFIKWLKFIIGLCLMAIFMKIMPMIYPEDIQSQNREAEIDAGTLFYTESPRALEKAYQLKKQQNQR